jgi:hypothetical protein
MARDHTVALAFSGGGSDCEKKNGLNKIHCTTTAHPAYRPPLLLPPLLLLLWLPSRPPSPPTTTLPLPPLGGISWACCPCHFHQCAVFGTGVLIIAVTITVSVTVAVSVAFTIATAIVSSGAFFN